MAISVTVPGSSGTGVISTNSTTPAQYSKSLAKMIADALGALPPAQVTNTNGVFPAHVNSLAVIVPGSNITVSGGSVGNTYDNLTIQDELNETITATGIGPFKVLAGTGGLNYTGLAGTQTVLAGGGTLGGASQIINLSASSGANFVAVGGGADTVIGGTGADTVYSGGLSSMVVSVGSGSMDFIGGANNATVFGAGTGSTTLIGGAGGSITYVNRAGGAVQYHAQGGSEVFNAAASSGNNTVYGAYNQSGTETLVGGNGNDYLDPLHAAASVVAGSGNDTLVGARFNSTVAGSGNATLTGGAGNDTFLFKNGYAGGHDYVANLTGADVVNLAYYGYNSGSITNLIASAVVAGGSSTITLSDATQITFVGITSLNSKNFTVS